MATWTTPRTWTDGDLTAADMNTIRDQLQHLHDRLSLIGVTSDSALPPIRGALYGCRLTGTANNNDGEEQLVNMSASTTDPYGFRSGGQLTIPTDGAGVYIVGHGTSWAGNASGSRRARISVNGTSTHLDAATVRMPSAGGSVNTQVSGSDLWVASAHDYLLLRIIQNSGSTLAVEGVLWAYRIAIL